MRRHDIGIGGMEVTTEADAILKTYALGSCVAIIAFDKKAKVAGLIHMALPDSSINLEKAGELPGYFVDTGLTAFFREFKRKGGSRENTDIKLVGGASILDDSKTFDIGRRNILAAKKFLWNKGLALVKEDTGGKISRTVSINIQDGVVLISNSGKKWEL